MAPPWLPAPRRAPAPRRPCPGQDCNENVAKWKGCMQRGGGRSSRFLVFISGDSFFSNTHTPTHSPARARTHRTHTPTHPPTHPPTHTLTHTRPPYTPDLGPSPPPAVHKAGPQASVQEEAARSGEEGLLAQPLGESRQSFLIIRGVEKVRTFANGVSGKKYGNSQIVFALKLQMEENQSNGEEGNKPGENLRSVKAAKKVNPNCRRQMLIPSTAENTHHSRKRANKAEK